MMSQTAKVLLLYAHPESQDSVANRVLLKPATQLSNVTVHDLYAHYPDFFIDIPYEQELLRQHDVIVFQHPLYTYSCPALLKEWLDRVLSRGFSSGRLPSRRAEPLSDERYPQAIRTDGGHVPYALDEPDCCLLGAASGSERTGKPRQSLR
ncbi:hypothetical protein L1887_43219 [Cichorium endivia]|nr:hypothetical protein L1887_43219 [Cichorium endivia]